MKVLLVDNETKLLEPIKELIPGNEVVRKWNDLASFDSREFNVLILSGGNSFGVEGNEEKLQSEIELVREFKGTVVGICFGCELIVKAFGGDLILMPQLKKGKVEIHTTVPDDIFLGEKSFEAYECHHWRIRTIPKEFIVLAESEHGAELIKHASRAIYGFQFHPEASSNPITRDIFLNVLNMSYR